MKSWYIITEREEVGAAFVRISIRTLTLVLICRGKEVKFLFKAKGEYRTAVAGQEVIALAKGKQSKYVKVVFRDSTKKVKKAAGRAGLLYQQNLKGSARRWDNE